ncbi:MAG: ABC transporter permease [Saprospiraceae bacterium]
MIKNYIKVGLRNLQKNKIFSFINLTGLSIGIAACILISVYILHEISYDKHVPNGENIYRLTTLYNDDNFSGRSIHFSANTASTLDKDFDEIKISGRLMDNPLFYRAGSNEISFEGDPEQHHEERFTYADQSILDIFSIPMVYGKSSSALTAPKTIVISEKVSKKYFKDNNPMGKTMYLNGGMDDPFIISGVMEDFPSTSHLGYDFLITLTDVEFGEGEQTRWLQNNYYIYFAMSPKTDITSFEPILSDKLILGYMKPALLAGGYTQGENIENSAKLMMQPIRDINLRSADIPHQNSSRNDIKIIWIFGLIALFILVIACINFINLSTAKSASRAKEVGLRKVIGSSRQGLIIQFLSESIFITFIAFIAGVGLSEALIPFFRGMTGIQLEIPFSEPFFIIGLISTAVVIGVLAGLYPAFYLSGFRPINTLKGVLTSHNRSGSIRSGLVVFQFGISIVLIVCTFFINKQLNYILNTKIGFEKEQVIQLYGTNMLTDDVQTFKDVIKGMAGVKNATISDYLPLEGTKRNGNSFVNEGREKLDETVGAQSWVIDEDYLETLGMKLTQGRNFDVDKSSDNLTTIINEEMVERLNLEDPIGKNISRYGTLYEVIGVVENFNYTSLTEKVYPLCFFQGISPSIISVKINTDNIPRLLGSIEEQWNKFAPNLAFRYKFMDESYAKMYDNVSRIRSIFTTFALLAIFVACLGLFALSAYMAEQRYKEIGIRKVLGASVTEVVGLLSKDFIKLVIIALILAVPISWWLMDKWLANFVFRIDMDFSTFMIGGLIALLIAFVTISFQSIKAAVANPVESLRSE